MVYVTVDIEVDFWDMWDGLSLAEQDKFYREIYIGDTANEVADMIYKVRYLDLYKDKSALEILEMVAQNIENR